MYLAPPPRDLTREIRLRCREGAVIKGAILSIAALCWLIAGWSWRDREAAKAVFDSGPWVEGRVIGKDVFSSEGRDTYHISYRFVVDGVAHEGWGLVAPADYDLTAVDGPVEVAYDPLSPADSYISLERRDADFGMGLALVFGSILTLTGILVWRRKATELWLWRFGAELPVDHAPDPGGGSDRHSVVYEGRAIEVPHATTFRDDLTVVRDHGRRVILIDPDRPRRWEDLHAGLVPSDRFPLSTGPTRLILPSTPRSRNTIWEKGLGVPWVFAGVIAGIAVLIAWFALPAYLERAAFLATARKVGGVVVARTSQLVTYEAEGRRNSFQIGADSMSQWPPGMSVNVFIQGQEMRTESEAAISGSLIGLGFAVLLAVLTSAGIGLAIRRRRIGFALWRDGMEMHAVVTEDWNSKGGQRIRYRFAVAGTPVAGSRHVQEGKEGALVIDGDIPTVVILADLSDPRKNRLVLASEQIPG